MTLTVADALREAKAQGVDRLDAQMLLAHLLARPRTWLLAHDDAPLAAVETAAFQNGLARRAAGEPLAYIVGEKEFHGLMLQVNNNVLVPRPDTEVLVDWALDLLKNTTNQQPRVVDLGTGSGAIALAVKHAHPKADVLATDVSWPALAVAQANAQRLNLPLQWHHGAWWAGLDGQKFDVVLSNPPYIGGSDAHLAALQHEPSLALTPGGDGLSALLEIASGAPAHLQLGGWLLLEHGWDQAAAVRTMLVRHGFADIETRLDLGGQARCTGGVFR
jgi:release factor glutamine methyltransferase